MLSDKMEASTISRMTIPSPISNMMQSDSSDHLDNIYYQYKTKSYDLRHSMGNNVGHHQNSLKRAQKVSMPMAPVASHHDQASQVPSHLTNDYKHIPVYIEHNLISKEMAV